VSLHDATRSEADLAMKCYRTFSLALKAVGAAIDHQFSSEEHMKIWAVVKAVAEGEQTLNASPAELQAMAKMLPAMRQHIQQNAQRTIQTERELAAMLVRAAEGFSVPEGPST
jgi:hypothetical protein